MKLVFCGTPEFAVPSLKAVIDAGHEVALVLTQPDRPAGRGMELQQSAVKKAAVEIGLPIAQPEKLRNNQELRERLESLQPDAITVVAFGQLIPLWMLDLPRFGNLNVHGSLLPKYRGAAPIQRAVANGDTETGVSIMRLDAGMDTGPVYLKRVVGIGPLTTSAELYPQLAAVGAEALVETLSKLAEGTAEAIPQDDAEATLAPKLTREDGRVDFSQATARQVFNLWRGFSPWPGAWSTYCGKRLILHRVHLATVPPAQRGQAGVLLGQPEGLTVGFSDGSWLVLDEVQLEGKARMPGEQFARDFQVKEGERLG
jgi:methionyl-tRNA formyltransferase